MAGTADLGAVNLPLDNPGVDIHWLGEVPCVAVLAEDHPLARKAVISATGPCETGLSLQTALPPTYAD